MSVQNELQVLKTLLYFQQIFKITFKVVKHAFFTVICLQNKSLYWKNEQFERQ